MAHCPARFSTVASIPTDGSMPMLWYTTSSARSGRTRPSSRLDTEAQNSRTTASADMVLPFLVDSWSWFTYKL